MTRLKFILIGLLLALASPAMAQSGCGGQFPAATICANKSASQGLPGTAPVVVPLVLDPSGLSCPTCVASSGIRSKLAANATFYVSSSGTDTATCAIISSPCATWNRLYINVASLYDFNGFTVTLTSSTVSTYTAGLFMNTAWVGGGAIIIDGGGSSITETVTKGIINNAIQPGQISIQNFALVSSTAFSCIQNAAPGLMTVLASMTIGTCNEADFESDDAGANLFIQNNYNVTGASGAGNAAHLRASYGGQITDNGQATYLTNRTYTVGTANAFAGGNIQGVGFTFSLGGNTVTGPRFAAQQGGNIFTNNGGANVFPGSAVGVVSPGGCYDTTCIPGYPATSTATSTITCAIGSLTGGATATWHYWNFGKIVTFSVAATPTFTSCTGSLVIPLPNSWTSAAYVQGVGGNSTAAGVQLTGAISSGATSFAVLKYDGTFPTTTGQNFVVFGSMEIQ